MENPLKEFESLPPAKKTLVLAGAGGVALLLYLHSKNNAAASASTDATSTTTDGTANSGSTDQSDYSDPGMDYGQDPGYDPWAGGGNDTGGYGTGATSGSIDDPNLGSEIGAGIAAGLIGAGDITNPTATTTTTTPTGGGAPVSDPGKHHGHRTPTRTNKGRNRSNRSTDNRTHSAGLQGKQTARGVHAANKATSSKKAVTPKKTTKKRR